MLGQWAGEVLGVALILGLLGHEEARLATLDGSGKKLERPDFDVTLADSDRVGVEQADVTGTAQRKHEAEVAALSAAIRDLLDGDPTFASAFGNRHITVFLSSHVVGRHRIDSKAERQAIQAEIERFVRSGEHVEGTVAKAFSSAYPILQSRGATWHSSSLVVPLFDICHGASNAAGSPALDDIIRVLDDHRKAAAGYRALPLWIALLLTDRWEFLRGTLDAVATLNPPIGPFERCYLADDAGRVLELRSNVPPVFHRHVSLGSPNDSDSPQTCSGAVS